MAAFHTEAIVSSDGSLILKRIPNLAGHKVEVIVKDISKKKSSLERYPLHGSVKKYDQPFEGVAENDWGIYK